MKKYDKIPYWNKGMFNQECIGFNKIDGSSMRFEWSKNRGFYKFGTRNIMIDEKDENFGKAIPLFLEKYGEHLPRIFVNKYKKVENFVVFAEYFGPNSFAGWHDPNDKMDIVLFDVNQYKRGLISPYEFVDNFGHLDIPSVIYSGKYTKQLINDVRNNVYKLDEGVVVKGITYTKKEGEIIWMTKIKTEAWLKKVKEQLGDKALADELNGDKELIAEYFEFL